MSIPTPKQEKTTLKLNLAIYPLENLVYCLTLAVF